MAASISPFFRSPFTDITGGIITHQFLGSCAREEMDLMDCLEAYGLDRGLKKCQHFLEDFRECQTKTKQFCRFMVNIMFLQFLFPCFHSILVFFLQIKQFKGAFAICCQFGRSFCGDRLGGRIFYYYYVVLFCLSKHCFFYLIQNHALIICQSSSSL